MFDIITIAAAAIFILGYAIITLEYKWDIHKSVTALLLGAILWLIISVVMPGEAVSHALEKIGSEIFGLILFLMAAMLLVETLVHYRFFDVVRGQLARFGFSEHGQFWVISLITFFLSALIDNMTTAIVMTQISRRFFKGKNLLIAAAMIVISANAGGAFSPIGDVTTIMLWLAGKFSAVEILKYGFFPALALFGVSTFLLARTLGKDTADAVEETAALTRSEKMVIGFTLASFGLPIIFSLLGLPPYLGLLFGVGLVYGIISFFKFFRERESHLTADISKILPRVDFTSLLFFAGILMAVGALNFLGILDTVSHYAFGESPALWRLVAGTSLIGAVSAIVDNIPLTAATITILKSSDSMIWVLFAIAVGTGGSMLAIGSAAGVVVMSMIKEMTFFEYMRIATLPAAAGYVVAIAIWYLQYSTSVFLMFLAVAVVLIMLLVRHFLFGYGKKLAKR
ncbi:MAG: sodium:proton antiporter NhaD [bacterium]|nr:sodium:proton antiporter NhaD [bacterium]